MEYYIKITYINFTILVIKNLDEKGDVSDWFDINFTILVIK